MHHIFITLVVNEKDRATGLAVVRCDSRGIAVGSYAAETTDDITFDKICDEVHKRLVANWDEAYVVVATPNDLQFARKDIELFGNVPWLDITQLAWPMVFSGMIPGRSVEQIASHFGMKNLAPDTATGNCELLVKTYWAMIRSYRIALLAEEGVRDYGGKIVQNIRQIIGF